MKAKLPKTPKPKSYPMFEAMCAAHGLPEPMRELRFHIARRWRFDFAWLLKEWQTSGPIKVALEIDGGVWGGGRHTRGKGFIADQEKLNEAALNGWLVLRCTPADVKNGAVFTLLKRAMRSGEFSVID